MLGPTFTIKDRKGVAIFDPVRSWVKDTAKDAALLEHERLHLRITEVFAKKYVDAINKIVGKGTSCESSADAKKKATEDYQKQVNDIYKTMKKEWEDMQTLYDTETKHGTDPEMQAIWEKKVNQMPR